MSGTEQGAEVAARDQPRGVQHANAAERESLSAVGFVVAGLFLDIPALAIAAINSFGNLSGIFAPWFIGWIREATGSFQIAMAGLGVLVALAGVCALVFSRRWPHLVTAKRDEARSS